MILKTTRSFDFTFYDENQGDDASITLTFRYATILDGLEFPDQELLAQFDINTMLKFLWMLLTPQDKKRVKEIVEWQGEELEDHARLGRFFIDPFWEIMKIIMILRRSAKDEEEADKAIAYMQERIEGNKPLDEEEVKKKVLN